MSSRRDRIRQLAKTYFLANIRANAAAREADEARKALFRMMKDDDITEPFDMAFKVGKQPFAVEVYLDTPKEKYQDVGELRQRVTDNMFMSIISATKKAVEEIAGKGIAAMCERERDCKENVYVKPQRVIRE